jgi:hypothetical protein
MRLPDISSRPAFFLVSLSTLVMGEQGTVGNFKERGGFSGWGMG